MYQKVTLVGRVGRDPETKTLQSGDVVCQFSIATSRKWKKNGQDFEKTVWWRVATWRNLAEICGQYVKKGALVLVEGEVEEPKVYQKRDGSYGCNLDVTASVVRFVGGKRDADDDAGATSGASGQPHLAEGLDEEIPF